MGENVLQTARKSFGIAKRKCRYRIRIKSIYCLCDETMELAEIEREANLQFALINWLQKYTSYMAFRNIINEFQGKNITKCYWQAYTAQRRPGY